MDSASVLSVIGQLEATIEADDRVASEKLLIAALALLAPDAALDACRRTLEAALESADGFEAGRAGAMRIVAEAADSSRSRPVAHLRQEAEQLVLGPAAGPLLQEALDEFIHAVRSRRDPLRFVSSALRCLQWCVGAEVEANDARRNPGAWSQEAAERERASVPGSEGGRAEQVQSLLRSSQRRLADQERWARMRQTWLRVVKALRRAAQ